MRTRPWKLIAWSLVLGIALGVVAVGLGVHPDDVIRAWLLIAPLYAIESTVSVWRLYWTATPRSWVIRLLGLISTIASISAIYVAIVSVLSRPPLPEFGVVLVLLAVKPFIIAYEIDRRRSRRFPDLRPPPFGPDD